MLRSRLLAWAYPGSGTLRRAGCRGHCPSRTRPSAIRASRSRSADPTATPLRRDGMVDYPRRFTDRVYLQRFRQAAAPFHVRLENVDRAVFDKLPERPTSVVVLASGERHPVDRLLQLDVSLEVGRHQRLLQPPQPVRAQPLGQPNRELDVEAHHRVVHQLRVEADHFSCSGYVSFDEIDPVDTLVVVGRIRHLECLNPSSFDQSRSSDVQ